MKHTKVNRIRITTTKTLIAVFPTLFCLARSFGTGYVEMKCFRVLSCSQTCFFNGFINQTSHRHNASGICEDINIYMLDVLLCDIFNDTESEEEQGRKPKMLFHRLWFVMLGLIYFAPCPKKTSALWRLRRHRRFHESARECLIFSEKLIDWMS